MKKIKIPSLLLLIVTVFPLWAKPNVVFVMLDDLGFSQIESFSRGLKHEDIDPKFLAHVEEQGMYSMDDAMEMMQIASPTISRLGDEGVKFNNAFACSNLCAPARIGIATGVLQNRWGIYRNIDTEAHGLKPGSHLVEKFKDQGYATAHIGKWHVGSRDRSLVKASLEKHGIEEELGYYDLKAKYPELKAELKLNGYEGSVVRKDHPLENGFDYYYGYNQWESPFYNFTNCWEDFEPVGLVREYNTDVFTDKARDFIEKSLEGDKPFFVQIHYHAVHHPLGPKAPEKYQKPFTSNSAVLNNFYAHIYAVDENIRLLLEYLEKKGEAENTIFVFTSDNGGAVGNLSCYPGNGPYVGHKGMLHQGGFRVPLIFHWPKGIKKSSVKGSLVSTLDIMPTLIDAAGGAIPERIDGQSLMPLIKDPELDQPIRKNFAVGGIHARVWAFNGSTSFFKHNVSREKAPSGFLIADNQYLLYYVSPTISDLYKDAVDGLPEFYGLYDYRKDPGERQNLAKLYPEKVQELKKMWAKESESFPPPVVWEKSKWDAMMQGAR